MVRNGPLTDFLTGFDPVFFLAFVFLRASLLKIAVYYVRIQKKVGVGWG